jgi:hypothetical protein
MRTLPRRFCARLRKQRIPTKITLDAYAASHCAVADLKCDGELPKRVRVIGGIDLAGKSGNISQVQGRQIAWPLKTMPAIWAAVIAA